MGFIYFNKIMIALRQVLVQTLGPNFTIKMCYDECEQHLFDYKSE